MTQILMLDVDIPAAAVTPGGFANELTFGRCRVRQLAAVDPLGVRAAGGRGDRYKQRGTERKRDRYGVSFDHSSHPL